MKSRLFWSVHQRREPSSHISFDIASARRTEHAVLKDRDDRDEDMGYRRIYWRRDERQQLEHNGDLVRQCFDCNDGDRSTTRNRIKPSVGPEKEQQKSNATRVPWENRAILRRWLLVRVHPTHPSNAPVSRFQQSAEATFPT